VAAHSRSADSEVLTSLINGRRLMFAVDDM